MNDEDEEYEDEEDEDEEDPNKLLKDFARVYGKETVLKILKEVERDKLKTRMKLKQCSKEDMIKCAKSGVADCIDKYDPSYLYSPCKWLQTKTDKLEYIFSLLPLIADNGKDFPKFIFLSGLIGEYPCKYEPDEESGRCGLLKTMSDFHIRLKDAAKSYKFDKDIYEDDYQDELNSLESSIIAIFHAAVEKGLRQMNINEEIKMQMEFQDRQTSKVVKLSDQGKVSINPDTPEPLKKFDNFGIEIPDRRQKKVKKLEHDQEN